MTARRIFALLCTIVLSFPIASHAQEEQAPVFGQQREYEWIHLDSAAYTLELLARFQDNYQLPNLPPKLVTHEQLFREMLSIDDHGYIVHPNIVELHLAGTLGWEERNFNSSDTGTNNSTGGVYDYDFSALILRNQTYPITLYVRRYEDLAYRDFGPTLNVINTEYGAFMEVRSPTFPSRFELAHEDNELIDPQGLESFTLHRNTAQWETQWHPDPWQTLAWAYSYNNITNQDSLGHTTAWDSHDLSLSHSFDFGTEHLSNLASSVTYFLQSGDFAQDRLRYDEYLRLHHTPNFETHYEYTFDRQSQSLTETGATSGQTLDQDQHRLQAGFRHQLYESLTTTGNIGWSRLSTSGGDEITDKFLNLGFDYQKKVPLGLLSANLTGAYDVRDANAQTSPLQVLNEADTFIDPTPVLLTRPGVVPSSILITDSTGTHIFSPILDYTILSLPDRVQINRVPGGAIASGQTVLIDYTVEPQPANTTTTTGIGLGARYDFKEGWFKGGAVYAKYFLQDQTVTATAPGLVADNIRDFTVGVQYQFWHITLSGEYQDHASDVAPFKATRFDAIYQDRLTTDTIASLTADYTMLNYLDINDQTNFLSVAGSVDHQFTPELHGVFSAGWRDERGRLLGSTTGFEEAAQLKWKHRQTTIYTTIRHVTYDTDSQKNEFLLVEIGIQRAF